MELRGKVALITGGGTGLGRVISLAFAQEGTNLAIVYSRREAEANKTADELRAKGVKAITVRGDVSQPADVKSLVDRVMEEYGRIDVLVNNAGTTVFAPNFSDLEAISDPEWDRVMAVNVKGPWMLAKAVGPIMKRQGQGRIIQTTSTAGVRAGGSSLAYTVSKAAEVQLTRGLALALGPEVSVNAIAPGLIDTEWGHQWSDEHFQRMANNNALKRIARLEDCAAAVVFLAKNDSMTGQTIVIDGGGFFH